MAKKKKSKAVFVRGHYRKIVGKKVYVKPHYRNPLNPVRRRKEEIDSII